MSKPPLRYELVLGHMVECYLMVLNNNDVAKDTYLEALRRVLEYYDVPTVGTIPHQLALEIEREIERIVGFILP